MNNLNYNIESVGGLREIVKLRRNRLEYLADAGRRGVDIKVLHLGSRQLIQINHPDLIRDVLVTHDWNFIKGRGLRASKPILGNGLLTSEGELHRRQRRLVQPAFHSARLSSYAQVMVECASAMCKDWMHGQRYAIDREMMRITLQIVGLTLFSADILSDAKEIGESLTRALQLFLALNSPAALLIPPYRRWVERRGAQERCAFEPVLRKVIEDHRMHPEQYDDMLSMLMNSHDDMGTGYMPDELLLDESLTLFLAGHETTANALTWTWFLLAQHPEVEATLRMELDEVLGGRLPTLDDVPRLKYTGRVFRESLRLYPPAWMITREAVASYRLGPVDVPPGAQLLMSPYATHHDSRFWPDPENFDPDRWLEEASTNRPKFAFYPFGAGTRVCIGEHFAMMEGVLLIAILAQQWRFQLARGQVVELWPQITLRPKHSIYFQFKQATSVPQGSGLREGELQYQ
jgi:cytochrome P450